LPALAAWLRRPTSDVAFAAYLTLTSIALTGWLASADPEGIHRFLALPTVAARLILAIGGAAAVVRALSRQRVSEAASLALSASALFGAVGLDRLHMLTFGAHLSRQRLAELYEALRSGAVRFDVQLFVALLVALVMIAVLLRALVVPLTYLPRPAWTSRRRLRAGAIGAIVLVAVTGDADDSLQAPLPWARNVDAATIPPGPVTDAQSPFGGTAEERMMARLQIESERVLAGPLSARRRPSIVVMHLESTRFDMLRDEIMPNTSRLSKSCLSPSHHYSTSNNTGSSMFGLLTGLPVTYYALARRAEQKPLPLEILKKLGYTLSAYYSSYLSTYDGLCDLYFKGLVDHVDDESNPVADRADAAMIDHYVGDVAGRDRAQPRFDYLVIESSHYDYEYPPAFEKFTPSATLGGGHTATQITVTPELDKKKPLVFNRYKNSVLWADSLVQRVVDAWAGARDDVIFVITGDHGEAFWEHGGFGHSLSLQDEQVRVPFVMCMPGVASTRYAYSSHEDVFPTVFDFMGLEGPPARLMAGKSLLRYDAARDLSVVGYGLTGAQQDDRLGVAGDGLKVVFVNRPPFDTISVYRDGDAPIATPLSPDVEARVEDLKLRAVEERITR
jgi:glucan phosphoethanolaminetransferase (alkaline phosphatase superfamily)